MMTHRHHARHLFWVVTCLALVVAAQDAAQVENREAEEENSPKEVTSTKEDVQPIDQTELLDEKTNQTPKPPLKKPHQNTSWSEENKNVVLRREGIPAIKPPSKELKNTIIKGRNLNESPFGSHNSLNETTTGAPKFRRKKRPNRVQSATEMSLPSTSAAWALASLITTPREKLVPLHGPVKPFIQWSTILVGSSTTETIPQTLSTEVEEPITPVSSTVKSQMDRSSQSTTESPTYEPTTKPVTSSTSMPVTKEQISKTTVTKAPMLTTTEQSGVTVTKQTITTVNVPDVMTTLQKESETEKEVKSEKTITTTEFDNAINKPEGDKKINIIEDPIPDTWKNAVSESTASSKPSKATVVTTSTSVVPVDTTSPIPAHVSPSVSASLGTTSIATTSPVPTTIPATTEATSPVSGLPQLSVIDSKETESILPADEDSSKNITLNLITPHPTTPETPLKVEESPIKVEEVPMKVEEEHLKVEEKPLKDEDAPLKVEEKIPVKVEDSSEKEPSLPLKNHKNASIVLEENLSELPLNISQVQFTIDADNSTDKSIITTTPAPVPVLNFSSTPSQPKEYNEILPLSEIFKETSEKTPPETFHEASSSSENPLHEFVEDHNLTSGLPEDSNIIETPDIFDDSRKPVNKSESDVSSVNNTGNVPQEITLLPAVENTTAKVIGTLYTVNKTVHITTKGPTSTFDNVLLSFNDTFPPNSKIDESEDISEDIVDKFLETIESTSNFSKLPEEIDQQIPAIFSSSTAPPTVIVSSTTISPPTVPSSIKPKETTTDENNHIGDDFHIYDLETTMITRLLIQANVITVCENIEELRSSILKLLQTDVRDIDPKQIVINTPDSRTCMAGISPREDNLVPVEIFMTDKNGESDNSLTDNFITLWRRDGLDFPYPVKKVEKIIGRGKWTRYGERESNNSTMAAIIISVTAGICLLLITILLIIIRKRHKGFSYGQRCTPVSLEDYSLDNISVYNSVRRKGARASKRSYGNPAFDDPGAISHVLNFATLASYCNNRGNIDEEFSQVPVVSVKPDELPPGVDGKNRFANVIPIPETRVPLPEAKPGTDKDTYINANFVKGAKGEEKFYIACQAPLKETVSDFWKMIWHHQCRLIVMLTELQEGGVEKCADYLPPSEVLDCHRVFSGLQVTLKKREVREKYIISSLQLKNLESNLWREVVHLWYVAWPHQGVPDEASSVIALLIEARSYVKSKENSSPIVIHCSPGTGRTGTIIAIDICIRDFEIKRTIDVPKTVYNIRKDRAGAVQTKDQYAFIYQVLHLYATKLTGGGLDSI